MLGLPESLRDGHGVPPRFRLELNRLLDLLGLVVGDEAVDDLVELAVQDLLQAVDREADAVVGDAALLEVVRADLLAAVARSDLALALARDLLLLLRERHLVEPCPQHLHGLLAVLDLALFVLAGDHGAAGDVGDAHGRVRGVDALSSRARRAERVDAEVLRLDLDVHLLGLREHGDGDGRGVDPARSLGGRHPLHAVHATLVAQLGVDAVAFDHGDDFLDAALARPRHGDDVDLPALALGEPGVHAEGLRDEQGRLLAARAGPDLEQHVLLVVGVLGQEESGDLLVERVAPGLLRAQLLVGHLPQLGVGLRADQLLDLGDLAERRLVGAVPVHHGRQLLGLAGQALVRGLVLGDGRVRHLVLDLAVTRFYVFEFLERYGIHWNPRGDCRLPKKPQGGLRPPRTPPQQRYAWAAGSFFLPYLRV